MLRAVSPNRRAGRSQPPEFLPTSAGRSPMGAADYGPLSAARRSRNQSLRRDCHKKHEKSQEKLFVTFLCFSWPLNMRASSANFDRLQFRVCQKTFGRASGTVRRPPHNRKCCVCDYRVFPPNALFGPRTTLPLRSAWFARWAAAAELTPASAGALGFSFLRMDSTQFARCTVSPFGLS